MGLYCHLAASPISYPIDLNCVRKLKAAEGARRRARFNFFTEEKIMDRFEEELKALFRHVLDKLERDDCGDEVIHAENYYITPKDICTDLQIFARDIYDGDITDVQENSIVVTFRNGQAYRISVSAEPEIKC